MHDFILSSIDTDAIAFCRKDQSPFTDEEQEALLKEVNAVMPKGITFAHDGYFSTFIVAAAKNYYMVDENGKTKVKGSAFKSSKAEIAVKELQKKILDAIVADNYSEEKIHDIYCDYIKEIHNLADIKRWVSRKTITQKVLMSKRKNETSIVEAITDLNKLEVGNKVWLYYNTDGVLQDVDNYSGNHDTKRLLKKIFSGTRVFCSFLDMKLNINFSLKTQYPKLCAVMGWPVPEKSTKKKASKKK